MNNPNIDIAVYQKPKYGNYCCGDSYFYKETDNGFICALADGLGSGEFAKDSADAVMQEVENFANESIETIVKKCNEVLIKRRGVVLGIIKMDFEQQKYSFMSIGNIGIIKVNEDGSKSRKIPTGGYLTGYTRPFKVIHEELHPGTVFYMFTDGVNERLFSTKFYQIESMSDSIQMFTENQEQKMLDDTTLVAMKYKE